MKLLRLSLIVCALLVLWQLFVYFFKLPNYILPAPSVIFQTMWIEHTLLFQQALPTLLETFLGFIFGALSGMVGALVLISFKPARLWLLPVLILSQAIPTFAIAPLLMVWFGYGEASKIITAIIMIFFPVTLSFYDGLRHTNTEWLNLAKTMGASRLAILWKIRVPTALPALASGLRIAVTLAPIGAIVGEWVGSSHGLGFLMLNANARMDIPLMFGALCMIMLLTLILYYSLDKLLTTIIFWQPEHHEL